MKNILTLILLIVLPIIGQGQDLLQAEKITPSNRASHDAFGWDIAIDGIDAIIGSPGKSVNGHLFAGAAYHYVDYGNGWEETEYILNQAASQVDLFGHNVAIHNGYCVIGAPFEDLKNGSDFYTNCGVVMLYKYENSGWKFENIIAAHQGALLSPETEGSFGWKVEMNDDYLFVGALAIDYNKRPETQANISGGVYIYSYDNLKRCVQYLAPDSNIAETGFDLEIAVHGDYLAVSYPYKGINDSLIRTGIVNVYKRIDSFYKKIQVLSLPNANKEERFGDALAFSNDYLAVRSIGINDEENDNKGKIWVYKIEPDSFTLHKRIILGESFKDGQINASLKFTDSLLFVGAPGDGFDSNGENEMENAGAVYIYDVYDDFSVKQKLVADDRFKDNLFGLSFDVNSDMLLVASRSYLNSNGMDSIDRAGAVYAFDKDGPSGLFKLRIPKLLNVYPSPAINNITIQIPKEMGSNTIVRLYSLSGALILEEQVLENSQLKSLNVEGIKPGAYLIKISDGNRSYSSRFIKE